jgi:hypothetical protein
MKIMPAEIRDTVRLTWDLVGYQFIPIGPLMPLGVLLGGASQQK